MSGIQQFLIDGYNVIYADDRLRRMAIRAMEHARDAFVSELRAFVQNRNVKVTLVFDGKGGLTQSEVIVPQKLQVIFSAGNERADDVIVRAVLESGAPRSFIVVTSDMADIGRRVKAAGAEVVGSRSFLQRFLAVGSKKPPKRPATAMDNDVDYWLQRFHEDRDEDS